LRNAVSRLPTSEISKRAGVAEGTLFTYFETKDDLTNSLYRKIKLELADAMMSDFPRKKNLRTRLQHVWDRYVKWGIANREQRKVLTQLQDLLTKDSREAGNAPFVEVQTMIREAISERVLPGRSPGGTGLEVVRSLGRSDDGPYGALPNQGQEIQG
jgi:AcrR family transcriptional regulator